MTGNQAFILASGNGGGGMTREEVIELIHETVKTPMHFKGLVGEGGDILDLPSPLNKDGDTYLVNADGYYANLPAMYYKVKTTHVGEDWAVGDPIRVDIWAGIDDTFVTYTDHSITPSFKLNDPGPYYPNPVYSPEVIQYTYLNTNTFQIWAKTEGIIIDGRTIEINNEVDYWYTNRSKDSTVFKIDGGTTFAKKGDMFCSVGDKWVLIPSGDEEPGMVYGGTVKVSSSSIEADYTGLPSPSADTAGMMLTVKEEGTYATSAANYYTVKVSVGGSPYYACVAEVYSDAARTQRVKTVTHDGTRETTVPVDNHIGIECLSNGNYKIHNDAPVFDTDTATIIEIDGYDELPYYAGGLTKNFSLSATKYAKVDDTFVCNGTEWILQNTHEVNSNYSTEEQDTGKLWVDGTSHVYARSFSGTIANGQITDILSTGVANITIINATGFFYNPNKLGMSLGAIPNASQWCNSLHVRDDGGIKKLAIMASSELYGGSYNITIEYIKTA